MGQAGSADLCAFVGVQPLQDIDEVNMFKDDNTVMHFKKPQIYFSVKENLLVVLGIPETKDIVEMLPEILKQVGPEQYNYLKSKIGDLQQFAGGPTADDDDVPELVGNFEDESKK